MSKHFDDYEVAQADSENKAASQGSSTSPKKRKNRRKTSLRIAIIAGVCLALLIGSYPISSGVLWGGDYDGEGTDPVQIVIPEGASGSDIALVLADNDVVKSKGAFVRACKADSRCSSIQPGTYNLKKQMSAANALSALLDPAYKAEIKITIPEGFTKKQTFDKISSLLGVPLDDVVAAAKDSAALGLPDAAKGEIEGWIAPLTYTFEPDTSAAEALKVMVAARVEQMEDLDIPEDKWEETLIKASIVEREVFTDADYGKVARVIENRLNNDSVNGLLQMDSTVLYGVGKTGGSPTQAELNKDTPYNTYMHAGLPPSPISNPGTAALAAACSPEKGDWLYFVTVNLDSGETKFSSTLDEHEKNIEEYRSWLAKNPQ